MPPDQLFTVVFTNHNAERVYASCRNEAVILAQAKQIKIGNSHMVAFVKNKDDKVI